MIDEVSFSIEIYSDIFFQCVICVLFLDFQFMNIVFLAIVRAMRSILQFVLPRFIDEMSPSKQSDGDNRTRQPRKTVTQLFVSKSVELVCSARWRESNYLDYFACNVDRC